MDEILEAQKKLRAEMVRLDSEIFVLRAAVSGAHIPPRQAVAEPIPEVAPVRSRPEDPFRAAPPPLPKEVVTPSPVFQTEPVARESIEMRVGTFWLVRVGIVILLTGLVFLGNYAYKNYFGLLGPAVRLAFFYLTAGAITALGLWLESRRAALQNYARVLTGGGLAALYYTTYAAHYVENLRVIHSPLLGGLLLLACAGFIAWLADRKRSQTLAVFAVALALFTSGMSRLAEFTLLSNLVLAVVAMGMVLRHGWRKLAFVTLSGTFGMFALWRMIVLGDQLLKTPEGWQSRAAFLTLYWAIFTAGALLARPGVLGRRVRAGFVTLNNGLAFVLLAFTAFPAGKTGFSNLCFVSAAVLGALVFFCTKRPVLRHLLPSVYLAQALFFFTLALLTRFTGSNLALILAVEAAFLVLAWGWHPGLVLRLGALGSAALATLACLPSLMDDTGRGITTTVAVLLFALAAGVEKLAARNQVPRAWIDGCCYGFAGFCAMDPLFFKVLPGWVLPAAFAGAAVMLSLSHFILRSRGLVFAGQFALATSVMVFLKHMADDSGNLWIQAAPPLALAVLGLAGGHLFRGSSTAKLAGAFYRIGAGALYAAWVWEFIGPEWRFLFLVLSAGSLIALRGGGWVRGMLVLLLNGAGVMAFLSHFLPDGPVSMAHLAAWVAVLVQSRFFAHFPGERNRLVRIVMSVAGLGGIWWLVTRWVQSVHPDYPLTVFWSVLALLYLITGFLIRDRVFRLAGFFLIALSLGRILLVDLWQLGTLVRIVSVLVTGLVLLVLGFVYTRYQDKIRRWL